MSLRSPCAFSSSALSSPIRRMARSQISASQIYHLRVSGLPRRQPLRRRLVRFSPDPSYLSPRVRPAGANLEGRLAALAKNTPDSLLGGLVATRRGRTIPPSLYCFVRGSASSGAVTRPPTSTLAILALLAVGCDDAGRLEADDPTHLLTVGCDDAGFLGQDLEADDPAHQLTVGRYDALAILAPAVTRAVTTYRPHPGWPC